MYENQKESPIINSNRKHCRKILPKYPSQKESTPKAAEKIKVHPANWENSNKKARSEDSKTSDKKFLVTQSNDQKSKENNSNDKPELLSSNNINGINKLIQSPEEASFDKEEVHDFGTKINNERYLNIKLSIN